MDEIIDTTTIEEAIDLQNKIEALRKKLIKAESKKDHKLQLFLMKNKDIPLSFVVETSGKPYLVERHPEQNVIMKMTAIEIL